MPIPLSCYMFIIHMLHLDVSKADKSPGYGFSAKYHRFLGEQCPPPPCISSSSFNSPSGLDRLRPGEWMITPSWMITKTKT